MNKLYKKVFAISVAIYLCGCTTQHAVYYQAYDEKWDDPTINPIFDNEWEAKDYAHRNNMSTQHSFDTSHSYVVRVINYRYEIRQINDWKDEVLYTTNSKRDGIKYVKEFSPAHEDLYMYDLKTGNQVASSFK